MQLIRRCLFILTVVALLYGCASNNPSLLTTWQHYSDYINTLDSNELIAEKNQITERHKAHADDEHTLKLAYILSRPNASQADSAKINLTKSKALLADIPSSSPYKPLAMMLRNEILLLVELDEIKTQAQRVEKKKSMRTPSSETHKFVEWSYFIDRLSQSDPPSLAERKTILEKQYARAPNDKNRLQLAYILRQATATIDDLSESLNILNETEITSAYAPLINIVKREVELRIQLHALNIRLDVLDAQLALLKNIDDDLSDGNRDVEELAE